MVFHHDPPEPDYGPIQQFLQRSPLYTWKTLDFEDRRWRAQPRTIDLLCDACGCMRPFLQQDDRRRLVGQDDPIIQSGDVVPFAFACASCGSNLYIWVEFKRVPEKKVRKVGQRPPAPIELPKDVAKALGSSDAELLKKARLLASQGYGIGACAYLRRVLEHQVNPILELICEVRRDEGAAEEELQELRAIIDGKVGEDKMGLAYRYAPRSIVVDGENPLKLLWEFFSVGIHSLPEDEAAAKAAGGYLALEFVVRGLHRAREDRKSFAEALGKLRRP